MIEITIELTTLQRITAIKERLEKLKTGIPCPLEVGEALSLIEDRLTELEQAA